MSGIPWSGCAATPLQDRLDNILATARESCQEFRDSSGAAPARRIGKLRDEFLVLYAELERLTAGVPATRSAKDRSLSDRIRKL